MKQTSRMNLLSSKTSAPILEDAFKIEIPDDQQEKLRTVQQAIDYIQANAK